VIANHVHSLLAVVAVLPTGKVRAAQAPPPADVVADVAVVADAAVPTLAFHVRNVGEIPVDRDSLFWGRNSLVVLTPSGRITGTGTRIADDFGAAKRRVIEPGDSASWEAKLAELGFWNVESEAGAYRVYWEYAGVKSNELLLLLKFEGPIDERLRERRAEDPHDGTPKGAVRALLLGLDRGDAPAVSGTLHAPQGDRAQAKVQGRFIQRMMAAARFADMSAFKFGKEAAAAAPLKLEATDERLRALDGADVKFPPYFETATIELPGMRYHLVRDGGWLVSAATFLKRADADARLATFERRTEAVRNTADEISTGTYKTIEDALRKLRERLGPAPTASADEAR
jgi:hypothetical protein